MVNKGGTKVGNLEKFQKSVRVFKVNILLVHFEPILSCYNVTLQNWTLVQNRCLKQVFQSTVRYAKSAYASRRLKIDRTAPEAFSYTDIPTEASSRVLSDPRASWLAHSWYATFAQHWTGGCYIVCVPITD